MKGPLGLLLWAEYASYAEYIRDLRAYTFSIDKNQRLSARQPVANGWIRLGLLVAIAGGDDPDRLCHFRFQC